MSRSLLILVLLVIPACGLFQSEAQLPTLEEVRIAREEQSAQWQRLQDAYEILLADPQRGWEAVEAMSARSPGDSRLAALIQDLRVEWQGEEAVRATALARYAEDPSAMNAWLLARRTASKLERLRLVEETLDLQPGHQPALVMQLALHAHAGDPEVLQDLIRLLGRQPGLAEGWRLLGDLAPLYARPDLALRAAETEPWSPYENPRRSSLAWAGALLAAGKPEEAIHALNELPVEDDDAAVLRASAHAAAGRPERARDMLERVVARDPGHAVAHFNLGLLYRDYLPDPKLSELHLQAYLDQADLPSEKDLLRHTQAEFWLMQLRAAAPATRP